jgi:hypothetical protein
MRWVYEKFAKCLDAAKFPDLLEFLPAIYSSCRNEPQELKERIDQAYEQLARIAEEKRLAALAAAAKAKEKGAGKKKGKADEEVKPVEVPKELSKPASAI